MKLHTGTELLVQPSGEMWKKIRVELNEDVNNNARDLQHIKDWLKKQPHLPDEWDEQGIMTFLRGCSFSLEKCKRKLDMYFTMRAAAPEFFTNRDVNRPELKNLMLNKVQGPPLPGLTPNGRRVIVCRGVDEKLESYEITDTLKMALMIGDVRLYEEREGVAGDVYVLDGKVLAPSHLGKLSPAIIKKFFVCVQEAYPVKMKEAHIVNASPVVEAFVNFVKPFLSEKLRKRIFIHKTLNDLYQYVPREMLPEEYGGDGGTMSELNEAWMKKLAEYSQWFTEQETVKANEDLRPGKPTNYDELFGIDGSFRQLAID